MPYTKLEAQKLLTSSFSEELLEVLNSRKEFADAITTIATLDEAEAVIQLGLQLLEEGLKLENVKYTSALMFALCKLTVNVVLEDYSVLHVKYPTRRELERDLETWTKGDRLKLHIPGTHILESYLENPVVDSIDGRTQDR